MDEKNERNKLKRRVQGNLTFAVSKARKFLSSHVALPELYPNSFKVLHTRFALNFFHFLGVC